MIKSMCAFEHLRLLDRKTWAVGLFAFAAVIPIQAQEDEEDIFVLSPFTVDASSDVGYRVSNSTSGTSLNTPIKDIPMSIEVINKDFLNDTGANSFDEALSYSSGVFTQEYTQSDGVGREGVNAPGANEQDSADRSPSSRGGLGGRFDNVVIIRGFNVPFQNRDGFRYGGLIAHTGTVLGGIIDNSNVDRLEVVRGPNSLLYGIGVLSGIVNVVPKRPLSAQSGSYEISAGSYGHLRSTLDVTGPLLKDWLGGQLNYRVSATYQEKDHWTDSRSEELNYYVAQLQYQSEKLTVFLEGQYADQQYNGIGDQFLYDNLNASVNPDFRNEFGEQYNWSKDFDEDGNFVEAGDYVDDRYRITGPDTYEKRLEKNVLLNADYSPIENFTISLGGFYTEAEEEEFNVNLSTVTNEEGSLDYKRVIRLRANDPNYLFQDELAAFNEQYVDERLMDVDTTNTNLDPTDYRFARYWWTKTPETTTTEQFRLRMTYSMETEDIFSDSKAKHTFLVGRHDIRDEAQIVQGTEAIEYQYASPGSTEAGAELAEIYEGDILQTRHINDHSIIRYNGEPTAAPGDDYRLIDIWFTGHYALYQGQFMNDRLGVILGARHDRYQSRERIYDRFDDIEFFGEGFTGPFQNEPPLNPVWNNPDNEIVGFSIDPTDDRYLPTAEAAETEVTKTIALNYKLTDSLTVYAVRAEGLTPNTGALDGAFNGVPSETSVSYEVGLKFDLWQSKLSGTLSIYRIERDNALWSYTYAPDPASWPVSGGSPLDPTSTADNTNSFVPEDVIDGDVPITYGIDKFYFEQAGIEAIGTVLGVDPDTGRRTSTKPAGYFNEVSVGGGTTNIRTKYFFEYDKLDEWVVDKNGVSYEDQGWTWRYFMEQAFADTSRSASTFGAASGPDDFDPISYDRERNTDIGYNISLGNITSANVTYSDESTGLDLNFVYSVNDNWQLLFSYAHTEREATSPFQLVSTDFVDDNREGGTGETYNFGTEYDIWVRTFGREAFGLIEIDSDNDGVVDQVTHADGSSIELGEVKSTDLVGGLQGTSLYTGAEDSASLWTKYSLTEGRFKNMGFGFGAVYTGPTATSIPIGGDQLAENQFGTPDTDARLKMDALIDYKWDWKDLKFAAKLNIYNLSDNRVDESVITYLDEGELVTRRTYNTFEPRNYRLTMSVLF